MKVKWSILFLLVMVLASCHYPRPDMSSWDIPQKTKDSLNYLAEHHYTLNANFLVRSDSIALEQLPVKDTYKSVFHGDRLVVAEFMTQPGDSIDSLWVKVARDQDTQGWIRESELLQQVVPTDSISRFIYLFSDTHAVYFLLVFIVFALFYLFRAIRKKKLQLVYFNDIDSIFPLLLCMLMAFSATLYESMQIFVPDTWEHYYFNPYLSPFKLPFILGVFVAGLWLIIVVALAMLDDLFRQVNVATAFFYLLGLSSVCIFIYLFFTFTVYLYVGYLFFALFIFICCKRLKRGTSYKYRCGKCGAKLREKGECPYCGAINH